MSQESRVSGAGAVENVAQPPLAKHDASILDLAFAMDCTGSMGSYIQNATQSIRQIVDEIVKMEKSDVRLSLIEYRDHPPQESSFVTRVHQFTESVDTMKSWLEACSAAGGGDTPEAVADALHEVTKLDWREKATKICVLISDAPPHGLCGDGRMDQFPNGCPEGHDPMTIIGKIAGKGITLYAVGCEPSLLPYKEFFAALAFKTGGQYVPLRNAALLAKVIVGGAVEEISLEKLMEEVRLEVQEAQKGGITDEKQISEAVQAKLKSRGVQTNQMLMNDEAIEKASDDAIKYSKLSSMADMRRDFKSSAAGSSFDSPMAYGRSSYVMPSSTPGRGVDSYRVEQSEINYAQSERLVQKVLNRQS